jgi:dCTP deaminase
MGLKPDHWIRKMAREHRMIEPFEDKQVREGVISYGVSSYGYDVRVADEFKIFTNVFSVTVDPKNFDTKSMVDFIGEVCIVPPNSFALARTVEYFRIPRNVLTICLGKSTYARCFRGDTRVALVNDTSPTLEEMTRRAEDGEMFWGYSIGENGRLIVALLDAPRYVGRDSLVEVTLDNDEKIHCTPDHQFMLRDGRWQAAGELQAGASLMPLYRNLQRGYEMVYQPLNGHLYPTHRLADEWNLRFGVYADEPGAHRHHADFDRLNNNPWNITRMAAGKALNRTGSIRGAARYLNCDRAVFRRFPEVMREFRGQGQNHKVVSVRPLAGDHDVFCLTVPETGNFALESGVIVHNCGIIVNVTPFEPEWEGYVTLEISNTTPLPAKIYANEGLAQVLFFEADEECEISYADKKGKYQKQQSIVLPKL